MIHLILACLLSLACLPAKASAGDTVYIYSGPGASSDCLIQTAATMEHFLKPAYQIKFISPEQLINDNWETDAALLIMPGGADIPYTKALNGKGNQKIRSYVENGGSFLGICAGSYYSGAFVDFAKGTPLEVEGARELAFFPGIVRGPILAPYDYQTLSGVRAAKILWNGTQSFLKDTVFTVYYNGGGYFVDAAEEKKATVLAFYNIEEKAPAIIECRVGRGRAILTGVHFEFDPRLLDPDNCYMKQIIPALEDGNILRMQLVENLLGRLNLKCDKDR